MFWNRKGRGKKSGCSPQSASGPVDCGWAPGPAGKGNGNGNNECSLSCVGKGCRCRIRQHHGQGAVRQRLLDMGFVPDTEVEVLRVATLGDPMEVKVGNSYVTLRKCEAEQIEVA